MFSLNRITRGKICNFIRKKRHEAKLYKLIQTVKPYTMVDPFRLSMLYELACGIANKVEGDIIECGVCNGGSAAILAAAVVNYPNKLWLYDTFEGIPPPTEKDGSLAKDYEGKLKGSIDKVNKVLTQVNFPLERIIFRKGNFKDTFQNPLPNKVALLHIDADWYESVLDSLRTFYSLVSEGGVVILDDFGYWEGARQAFYDFCAEYKVKPLVERFRDTQLFWYKGKENNR
ncbi:MAG: macrocin O-methyltransferase [Candidatus Omnitrophica bacterium]|nr:macrocin O-methyltransferase [Candidatus Omnitrophota bacterium]